MLDVYEHFPADKRPEVHAALARLLTDDGVVILSVPSPKHQAFLRVERPEGLQPVDEDITHAEVTRLAEDLGGEVAYLKNVTIWRPGDYSHAVVQRIATGVPAKPPTGIRRIELEPAALRRKRVERKLHKQLLAGGQVIPALGGPAVCIACQQLNMLSETFITNHICRLPLPVRVLYGAPPQNDGRGRYVGPSEKARLLQAISRRLGGGGFPGMDARAVARYLRRSKVAVMLAEFGTVGVQVMKACAKARVPLVVHFHGYDAYVSDLLKSRRQRYAEMFRQAAAVVAVSRDMQQQLVAIGAPAEKVVYNPYGVDTSVFKEASPDKAPPHFLAVGRFVQKKAPHLTLLAFARVLESCPDARLSMIGDGPLLEPCRQISRALGISHVVRFAGPQDQEFVSMAMRNVRALVQHSIRPANGDSEGTPLVVIEAQATGLPVVATAHAGIKDVVLDGQTGFLVDEFDRDAMAVAMTRLARDPNQAAELGHAGRQRVMEHFSLPASLQKLAEILVTASGGKLKITTDR